MMGMETMLASMLGTTPEELKSMAEKAVNLLGTLDGRLSAIEKQVSEIHTSICTVEHTDGKIARIDG